MQFGFFERKCLRSCMSDTASEPFAMKKSKGAKFGSFLLFAYLAAADNEDVAVLLRCASLLTLT